MGRRGIRIKARRQASGLDDAADRAALFLGDHFNQLRFFYEAIKRRVNGSHEKWLSLAASPKTDRTVLCRFGARLHDCGFLSEFRYVKRDECLLFVPLDDGRVKGFFTGGWLERYLSQVVRREVQAVYPTWGDSQMLQGVKVTLQDGSDAEFDLLVALDDTKVLWLECKTGEWQTYISRFRTLNSRSLRLEVEQAGVVLLATLSEGDRASARELTGMSVLTISEVPGFVRANLQRSSACSSEARSA